MKISLKFLVRNVFKPCEGNGDFSQNFTRMQIIGHKLKKQFVLFKRQGQVGQDGEWKIQPFSIPENAIREFMKLYKAKTGNEWTALPEFRRCTKKSALVPFDLMNRIQAADLEFDLEFCRTVELECSSWNWKRIKGYRGL